MSKAKIIRDSDGLFYGIRIDCPGCLYSNGKPSPHLLPVNWRPPGETVESPHISWKDRWGFNGDLENPTFTPSLNTWLGGEHGVPLHRCHSFIANGKIQFLGDCTHALSGQTVDLPEIDP